MINDLITNLCLSFDDLLSNIGFYTKFTSLLSYLDDFETYTTEFHKYLSGVYYIFGKPLVTYIVTAFIIIAVIRIIMAVVNIIGQFVP